MFGTDDKNVTANRQVYVGGSDVPIILGISKYKTQFDLAKEKAGLAPQIFDSNEYTVYGQAMEPQIRDYINAVNETNFYPDTTIDKEKHLRGNCDGADYTEQLLLEIKTHGKKPTMESYEVQIQLYLHMFELQTAWLALYERPDNFDAEFEPERLKIEVIQKDEAKVEMILQQIEIFWQRVEALQNNPELTQAEFYSIGADEQNEIATVAQQVASFEVQLESFKELEKQYKDAKERLYELMMEHKVKSFKAGKYQITLVLPTSSTKEEIDIDAFKESHPRIARKLITEKITNRKGYVKIVKAKKEA